MSETKTLPCLSPEDLAAWRRAVREQSEAEADVAEASALLQTKLAKMKRLKARLTEEYELAEGDILNERTGQIQRKGGGSE